MRVVVAVLLSLTVMACGRDGEPLPPPSTDAAIGVNLGTGGAHVNGAVGWNRGPFRIGVGF